jgi:hypothetical protein
MVRLLKEKELSADCSDGDTVALSQQLEPTIGGAQGDLLGALVALNEWNALAGKRAYTRNGSIDRIENRRVTRYALPSANGKDSAA